MTLRITRGRITALVAVLAVAGAVLTVAAGPARTQAAWTDRSYTQATVTAGTWNAPSGGNTCTAVNQGGNAVKCTVTGIRYEGWGTVGDQTRNYYIDFDAPAAKTITFSVDLTTATGAAGAWSWTNAGVSTAAQFAGTSGWTCSSLPRITGRANDWLTTTVYFPVYENKTGKSVMCS
ncbi:MAG: hypothetical protein J0I97_03055 [Microbacterium sp.]|uniref:hypothetical protein n=1 Tax=Microbacterium sp. TaxID=51671 RepID=UPI001AC9D0BE|nr:hypothetical protein [Microbacterium sp.]MBN9152529.1 hypothetical protein [Microbacterium sp.]MBN9184429.1 hypothetical protein [Microbacterium sp.]